MGMVRETQSQKSAYQAGSFDSPGCLWSVLFVWAIRTQREIFKKIVFKLRIFALENRVSTFRYQCSQY